MTKAGKAKTDAGASFKRAASSGKLPLDGSTPSKSKRSARASARSTRGEKKKDGKTPPDSKGASAKSPFHATKEEPGSTEGASAEGAASADHAHSISSADSSYVVKSPSDAPPTTAPLPRVIDVAEAEELEQLRSLGVGTPRGAAAAAAVPEAKEEAPTRAPVQEVEVPPAVDPRPKPAVEGEAAPTTELAAPAAAPAPSEAQTPSPVAPAAAAVPLTAVPPAAVPLLDVEDLRLELDVEPAAVEADAEAAVPEVASEVAEEEAKVEAQGVEEASVEEVATVVAPPRRIELVLSAATKAGGAGAGEVGEMVEAELTKVAAPLLVYALHDAATLHGADGILSSGIPTPSPTPAEGGESEGGELILHPSYPSDAPHGPGCSVYIWVDVRKALADGIRFHEDPSIDAVVSKGRIAGWTAESGRASSGSIPPDYFSSVVELRDGLGEMHPSKAARLRLIECCFPGCASHTCLTQVALP